MSEDRSLADPTGEPVVMADPVISDQPLNPETFDFEQWLAGASPINRSIRVYAAGKLVAVCDQIADQLDDLRIERDTALARGDQAHADLVETSAAELENDLREARAAYEASGLWWTVEGRSDEWVGEFRREWAKTNGRDVTEEGYLQHTRDVPDFTLALIAAVTVQPAGVTEDNMRRLRDAAPLEVKKLAQVMTNALTEAGEVTSSMTEDFSLRPSTSRAGRASS